MFQVIIRHNTWNHILCNQNVLSLYNSSGLTISQKNEVISWFGMIYNRHVNNFIPVWSHYRDDDGGWNWGTAYSMWSLGDQYTLFENMRIGTNKNFFQDLSWVQNSINQYLYFNQPDRKSLHIGDGETELKADIVTYLNAKHYNDLRSIWLSQNYSSNTILNNTMEKYSKLLYKDFTTPIIPQPSIPLDWFSDKVGIAVSRSSWQEDATMTTFFNSISKRAAHEHRDNNSFTIFKNSPLMIDSGFYDTYQGSHHNNYYSRTIAHNSICVFDANENYTNIGFPVSNDGGQIESPHLKNLTEINLPENQRGNWIQNAFTNDYNYSVSDAQLSYNPNKLEKFRRRFLFIKPEKVIVLDHIELNSSNPNPLQLKWIGHFVNEPSINGSLLNTTVPNHIETYNGKDYFTSNGNGNIAIRTLLPLNSKTTLIGGEGYEYWVNGQNYEPISTPNPSQNVPGNWRIEVEPITVENNSIFLHTIDIGDNSNVATSGGISLESSVSIGVDWENTIYFFSKDGEINKENHLLNNIEGNRTITLFATDLFPYSYSVLIDGIEIESLNSDANGVLKTTITLSSGNHTIEIIQNPLNNQDFSFDTNDVLIYPNPIENKAIIKVKTDSHKKIIVNIYDVFGKKVTCSINYFDDKITIEKGNLQKGIYIVKIVENGNILGIKKIIIQ